MISTVAAQTLRAGKKASALRFFNAWSGKLSFSSPEADFYHITIRQKVDPSISAWSRSLSYASPEGDFGTSDRSYSAGTISQHGEWSGKLSFASPESDFTADPEAPAWEWPEQLSFASPESDFQTASVRVPHPQLDHDQAAALQASPVMGLTISCPESASGSMFVDSLLEDYQMYQLHEQRENRPVDVPLPRTLQEALADQADPRAIVVAEAHAPFHIVDVNDAWVGLCGYSKEEARHHSLRILQGPATNPRAVNFILDQLMNGEEAETLVTNYTKVGRKFYNYVRAGPLYDANDKISHFVGVLEEAPEQPEYFHVVRA